MKKINIAIDGFAGCGKSTTAREVAKRLNYIFIDSGAMYRAVSLYLLEHNVDYQDVNSVNNALKFITIRFDFNEQKQLQTYLNNINVEQKIRTQYISEIVSEVSTIKSVRTFLVDQQKRMGEQKGVVMDGRDIGSVVFPDAELKIFMNASLDARVARRIKEYESKSVKITHDEIKKNLIHRDELDSTRKESPLIKSHDAIDIDTSLLSIEEQVEIVLNLANKIINACSE